MIIKDTLIKEYLKTGNLQKSTARLLVKIGKIDFILL